MREAIARGSAVLEFGRYRFLYTDTELGDGGHVLRLTPLDDGASLVLEGCSAEQRVPPGLVHWDAETRARLVRVLAIAFFHDVAKLVQRKDPLA